MIRWFLILFLFLALAAATDGPPSVTVEDQRAHLVAVVQHVCHRTAHLPDELERCQYIGNRAITHMEAAAEEMP